MSGDWLLAVDIGGTKLAAARLLPDDRVDRRGQRPTGDPHDADALWDLLTDLLDEVVGDEAPAAVGVGCGGPMRWPAGEVSPLNISVWRDFPLRHRLADRYDVPVTVHNDAVAMALAEQRLGAGRGAAAFLGIVVSTGVGGGVVLDGRPLDGPTGNAGHIGHVVVDPAGPACVCGGRGCLEAVARGPALVAWAHAQGWRQGEDCDGRRLVADAEAGDATALAALTRAGSAVGVAVASVAAVLDLDLVAVGGGLATGAGELLLDAARAALRQHAGLDFVRRCRIVPAGLGVDAGLVGAGLLARAGVTRAAD